MIKLLSLFSGIGAFEKALDRLNIDYELVNFCEFDKYAVKSYCAIHETDESKNLGDITKVDEKALPKDIDLITYGFPCQDISLAGKLKGLFNEDGTKTRSGLFFEALRIIEETQPKIAIAENVKNLIGKKFNAQFQIVLSSLDAAGYNSYYQVLNAKDFGIPQNRERVFIVSIRKDIDKGDFSFPETFPLESRLKDILEEEVDEKFYLSNKMLDYIEAKKEKPYGFEVTVNDVEGELKNPIRSQGDKPVIAECIQVGQIYGFGKEKNPQAGRVYDSNGISPTMDTCQGGNRMPKVLQVGNVNPSGRGQNGAVIDSEGLARTVTQEKGEGQKILIREATAKGYAEAYEGDSINLERPNSKTRRGRVGRRIAQTVTTTPQQAVVLNPLKDKTRYGWHFEQNVYGAEGVTRAIKAGGGSGNIPKVIEETQMQEISALYDCGDPFIVSSRGRNPENPSDRTAGAHLEQRLEANSQGICNTLSTVQKDNYVAEPYTIIGRMQKNQAVKNDGVCTTLTSSMGTGGGYVPMHNCTPTLRIRKLTPKECFRLMGFADEDFEKAEKVNSNTQLYKQAGNSIVVDVLVHLFTELFQQYGEVLFMQKVEESRLIVFETEEFFDVAALKEKEPELFADLVKDYPAEKATYEYKVI